MKKIIINESQIKLLNEDLFDNGGVSHNMRETIAVWCLMNDFRFYSTPNPNILKMRAGNEPMVCNTVNDAKWFAEFIMSADSIKEDNDSKEIFGYIDYDDNQEDDDEREEFMDGNKIYRITKGTEDYLIEIDDNLPETQGNYIMNMLQDGDINLSNEDTMELLKWFYHNYR